MIDRESYENKEIAEIINKNFIAIKVDRDERPDIDRIHQEFAVNLSGQGGWPLTVFLTPDKIPFYAGTYFPPEDRFGIPSFKRVLLHVSKTYREKKSELSKTFSHLLSSFKEGNKGLKNLSLDKSNFSVDFCEKLSISKINEVLKEAEIELLNSIDPLNGGFGFRPKFPNTSALLFLLTMSAKHDDKETLSVVKFTLRKMAEGGIYDQIGGGFHRYAVDEEWKIPHFEKLLPDNALLLSVYLTAYNISKEEFFKKIALNITEFILNEFYDDKGYFYASQDADIDDNEGLYFTWMRNEINSILSEEEAKIISWHYGVDDIGEMGIIENSSRIKDRNVLYIKNQSQQIAEVLGREQRDIEGLIESGKKKLLLARNKRKKPFIDKTLFTNWNAIMIDTLLSSYTILKNKKHKEVALKSLNFIIENLCKDNVIRHSYSDICGVDGFLDDYMFLIQALILGYEITDKKIYLERALSFMEFCIKNFWDDSNKESGGFYFANKKSDLIRNDKPYLDYSTPAENSIAVINLLRLHRLCKRLDYYQKAERILQIFSCSAEQYLYKASYLIALNHFLNEK